MIMAVYRGMGVLKENVVLRSCKSLAFYVCVVSYRLSPFVLELKYILYLVSYTLVAKHYFYTIKEVV